MKAHYSKAQYAIFTLFLSLGLLISCVDDSREFQKFDYNPEDYPNPADSPYHIEDYHILKKSLKIPQVPYTYTLDLPQYMVDGGVRKREILENSATLGRVLFYDKNLSQDRTVSCASCHRQAIAFSDNTKLSVGIKQRETKRNSIALGSWVSFGAFNQSSTGKGGWRPLFWDYKGNSSAHVSELAITNIAEMGMEMEEAVERIQQTSHYPILFKAAFGDEEITDYRLLKALEAFVESMGSYESKFDEGMIANNGDIEVEFDAFNESENRGKALYIQNCGVCHGKNLLRTVGPSNNGLDQVYTDPGIQAFYVASEEIYVGASFKTPALRNVALTAPYMHDGRFESLEEVLDFYSTGIQDNKDLGHTLRDLTNGTLKFNFTEEEKTDLLAFLETLTDEKFLNLDKYSDPFK